MKKIAVCLSGCGFLDGAEIHEAVLTLLAIDQAGAQAVCCAPDVAQAGVIDHVTKRPAKEGRNVLVESARIARGEIKDIKEVRAADIDALIFPGGFGAAKNLCTFAEQGANCTVNPGVERLAGEMLDAKKPIGAICIAPALLSRIVGKKDLHPKLTIGTDKDTAAAINAMGAQHCDCAVTEMVTDEQHKIVSTPAYMLGRGPAEVFEGIRKLVNEVLRMA
ncbi:MAG TPA: isoprenoid biosynthesis glyoxalase ElbB [Phycisphaerae bacterium]|nr:isoprenoid biosynthesis glyoxalase ElbB [Phycisphaerae bacterium]